MSKFGEFGGRRLLVCAGLALALVGFGAAPAAAVPVVSLDPIGPFSDGDVATYSAKNITSSGSFYLEFQVAENGMINFTDGIEANSALLKDLQLTSVVLTNETTNTVANGGASLHTVVASNGKTVDSFTGSWISLLVGNVYRLTVAYTAAATGAATTFAGNISFAAIPVPPALLMFGSGIVGLAFLARRRKAKAVDLHSSISA